MIDAKVHALIGQQPEETNVQNLIAILIKVDDHST